MIYEAIEDVKKAMEGLLEPTLKEKILGRAEVRQTFQISRIGTIAGCYVIDGVIQRASDGIRGHQGQHRHLRREGLLPQDDSRRMSGRSRRATSAASWLENFNDLKVGDILEDYVIEKIAAKL
ncbi:MAG: hypothetical protein MZU95_05990 [Desulfomicrobium escambiense]|nr:hypothetical protein [Desulfomicrobium escambiense]